MTTTATAATTTTVLADDGARLAVQVHGPRAGSPDGAPTTLVLAHGWTLTHRSWDPVVERVAGRDGLRVVTWDQRGHGGSTLAGGRYRGSGLSIRRLGRDLATALEAVAPGGPLVLVGHSMGGMTLMAYAGLHPTAVDERVRGVGFVATSAGELGARVPESQKRAMRLLAHGARLRPGRAITTRGQRALLFGDDADPAAVELTRAQVAATPLAAFGGFHGALMRHDEVAALSALADVPVRVLVGSRDRLTPERHARALVEALPRAELEVVPGAGHMLTYEATDRVVALVEALLAG